MELLRLDNLEKQYAAGKGRRRYKMMAVDGVSLSVKKGECVGLVGESGCGKSTLGRLITGLEPSSEGRVYFQGEMINSKTGPGKSAETARGRKLQMVFQDSLDAVNPRFTAGQIIKEPLDNYFRLNAEEKTDQIERLLNLVGLSKADRKKYPHQFSGGQLQRVCIARALASNPELIVLDEPLSSLDVSVQAQILNLLRDLKSELGLAFILISHDLEAVYYLADSIMVMYGGRIMERIESMDQFDDMAHPYTLKLLSSTNTYAASRGEKEGKGDMELEDEPEEISINMVMQMEGCKACPYSRRCPRVKNICKESCPELKEIKPGHFAACHLQDRT